MGANLRSRRRSAAHALRGVLLLASLASIPVGSAAIAAEPAPAPTQSGCENAAEVLAATAGSVAERIYAAEVRSSETDSDKRQIESYGPLLSAMQSGDHEAIATAVHHLVYSHTHIVRLRVSRGSELLYDEGGPYILAPIEGRLRLHGKEVGHFVFSVQDDLGYVKLVTRFIGAPLVLRTDAGQVPVEGLLSPGPDTIPDRGPVSYHGTTYEAYSFRAEAYPSGRLRVSLLLGVSASLQARTCMQVKAQELGLVAQRISRRFQLSSSAFPSYVKLVHTMTHALVFIRSGGHVVAGSSRDAPAKLPDSGALRFHGAGYEVASFTAPASGGSVRVHVLVPAGG